MECRARVGRAGHRGRVAAVPARGWLERHHAAVARPVDLFEGALDRRRSRHDRLARHDEFGLHLANSQLAWFDLESTAFLPSRRSSRGMAFPPLPRTGDTRGAAAPVPGANDGSFIVYTSTDAGEVGAARLGRRRSLPRRLQRLARAAWRKPVDGAATAATGRVPGPALSGDDRLIAYNSIPQATASPTTRGDRQRAGSAVVGRHVRAAGHGGVRRAVRGRNADAPRRQRSADVRGRRQPRHQQQLARGGRPSRPRRTARRTTGSSSRRGATARAPRT